MRTLPANKEEQIDIFCEELLREKAAVLARAGFAVENALASLAKINQQFEEKIGYLQTAREDLRHRQSLFEEINALVDQFNAACRKADVQYYYLIVTREAMGLRRHETVQQIYRIPPKKKKIQAL
jgi:L-lactate utilization protein LutB